MKKNIGIILAGGSGQRVGGERPKQLMVIAGKTVLEHSLTVFQNNRSIDEIIIVGNAGYLQEIRTIANKETYPKVSHIISGGAERHHSTLAALEKCGEEECNLIIHDAVRPLVTTQMIDENISALTDCDACTTALPTTDTILESDPEHAYVRSIPDRTLLYNVQTPQSFKKTTLQRAYTLALQDPCFHSTDDCGVVCHYLPATRIKIVIGTSSNLKLTYKEDIQVIEKLLNNL